MSFGDWRFSEEVGVGLDPDDLAVLIVRHLRAYGVAPTVALRVEDGKMTGIEIRIANRLIALLPCMPIDYGPNSSGLAKVIEAIGKVGSR